MDTQTATLQAPASSTLTHMVTATLFALGLGAGAFFGVAVVLLAA